MSPTRSCDETTASEVPVAALVVGARWGLLAAVTAPGPGPR